EEALKLADELTDKQREMMARRELRDHEITTGERTGKPGRPKKAEALQVGETRTVSGFDPGLEAAPPEPGIAGEMQPTIPSLQERARGGRIRLPDSTKPKVTPADVGIPKMGQLKQLANSKGLELVVQKNKVYLYKSGGGAEEFNSLREANQY